jgi:hypothetical protein
MAFGSWFMVHSLGLKIRVLASRVESLGVFRSMGVNDSGVGFRV